jgi:hypothetical protein
MMNGYVKFFRTVLDHELLANDNNAYIVFTKLLLRVDRKTGNYTTGRFKLAELTNLKPSTAWATLKRLKNHKMVTLRSDSRKTVIHICNWHKFQTDPDRLPDNNLTTNGQPDDTKQERRKKKEEVTYVQPDKPDAPKSITANDLLIQINAKLGGSAQMHLTAGRKDKLKRRLKTFTPRQLLQAAESMGGDPHLQGDNDRSKRYGTIDFFLRNDEKIAEHLEAQQERGKINLAEKLNDERYF